MAFNDVISRNNASPLIPEQVVDEIFQMVPENSAVMSVARQLPRMSRKQERIKVLNTLPQAFFTNSDTGLRQTTNMEWKNKYLYAEDLDVIVPIPRNVLADAEDGIWEQTRPHIAAAIGQAFDEAVLHGTGAPDLWPDDIATAAAAAGNSIDQSVLTAGGSDLYDILLGEGGVISTVELDGYEPNGHIGKIAMKAELRGARDDQNQPLFNRSPQDRTRYELEGAPIFFPKNGSMNGTTVKLFTGDWNQLVWCYRQDMEFEVLTESSLYDNAGQLVYALAQQKMVALMVTTRLAWQYPNPTNKVNGDEGTRFPFAVLVP